MNCLRRVPDRVGCPQPPPRKRAGRGPALPAAILMLILAGPEPVLAAESCPDIVETALRFVLVTTARTSAKTATVTTFERATPDEPWEIMRAARAAVVGQNGLGWGLTFRDKAAPGNPVKVEGDKRTPAGIFRLGRPFGFGEARSAEYMQLQYGETFCVNDPSSPLYNKIVPRRIAGKNTRGEEMRSFDLYRHGFVIDYPTSGSERAGSCIFLHVWRSPQSGTAGCVALAAEDVADLQEWVRSEATAIAILSEPSLVSFAGCLPQSRLERRTGSNAAADVQAVNMR